MKVSINLAQEYSNVDLKSISSAEMLKKVGAQLGAVEEVIYWAPKYDGVVVVKVVECEKHPNADKLHVCKIDDGGVTKNVERDSEGLVQVVCGAPNVKKNMFVAWIPPRSVVPSTKDTADEFILEARELRGVVSNGMLASAHELGINDDHSGILEITKENSGKNPTAGESFSSYFGLDDVVIDCENKMFTHRPDCFGNLGVTRELAGINGLNFKSPDWYMEPTKNIVNGRLPFKSKNDISNLVPRFMAQVVEGVKVEKSNLKMQVDLMRVGLRPLNNIVDYTNYFMHLTAQPTHAFDYDKIKALSGDEATIFPRMAKDGEEITLLNGKTIKLTKDDIVIATDKKAVALAGVMGGAETEVDDSTKNVIIECASFDMYTIRRTSMRHGLFTDAVTRFNKGQSPFQNEVVLSALVSRIIAENGAVAGKIIDLKSETLDSGKLVKVSPEFISQRLGRKFGSEEILDLLSRTEFKVSINEQEILVEPPFWRRDIELPEDVVEEVGRLFGFDSLPKELPTRKSSVVKKNQLFDIKRRLASSLKSFGANEVLTYSFIHGELLKTAGQDDSHAFKIRNALSPDLQYYRISLTPSLLSHVHHNIKSGYDEFALFEIGSIHNKKYGNTNENVPVEKPTLGFVYTSSDKLARKKDGAAYYTANKYLESLLSSVNISYKLKRVDEGEDLTGPFEDTRSATIVSAKSGSRIGVLGEFKVSVRDNLKIPKYTAGFEIYLEEVLRETEDINYKVLSKYPGTEQDITLEVPADIMYAPLEGALSVAVKQESSSRGYDIEYKLIDIFSDNPEIKRYSFRINLSHQAKTLRTDEVNETMGNIVSEISKSIKVKRI